VWDIPEDWEVAIAKADKKAGRTGKGSGIMTGEKKERKKWTKKKKKREED
jgi:hypothetical protein